MPTNEFSINKSAPHKRKTKLQLIFYFNAPPIEHNDNRTKELWLIECIIIVTDLHRPMMNIRSSNNMPTN